MIVFFGAIGTVFLLVLRQAHNTIVSVCARLDSDTMNATTSENIAACIGICLFFFLYENKTLYIPLPHTLTLPRAYVKIVLNWKWNNEERRREKKRCKDVYSFLDKNAKRCKIRFFYNKTQKTAFVVFQEQHNAVNIFLGGYLYTIYILIQCTHTLYIFISGLLLLLLCWTRELG